MKKLLLFLMIISLLAALFCGCANEAVPTAATEAVTEAVSESDLIETEVTETEAPEPELPEHYAAYRDICEERLETYGVGSFVTENSGDSILTGLSIVRLLDFDSDGTEDLLLVYMTDYGSIWSGAYEVWTYKDGEAIQAACSDKIVFSNGGWFYFDLFVRDGKTYIVGESDYSWDPDDPYFAEELWGLSGTTFELEERLLSTGNGGSIPMHYYRNDEEISESEYDEGLNDIWHNSDTSYLSVNTDDEKLTDGMQETLRDTKEVLQTLGVTSQTEQSESVTPEEAPYDDAAAYVGEWVVDWEQSQAVNGKGGQDMFGTSVRYGTSMVLTADYQISYAFSFYGGSGTYHCDGDRITVDSTPTEPSIDSPLQTLTPVYVGDRLYLCMDLSEVLPGFHDGECLYWKLK